MSIKEIKKQIHLLTTIKLILQIDNRINDWKNDDEIFKAAINKILTENGIPEDKHLGPFFLSDNELASCNRKESLTGKLFMYLWDDVLRHGMSELVFKSEIKTYGQLTRDYQSGKTVLGSSFFKLVKGKLHPIKEGGAIQDNNHEA